MLGRFNDAVFSGDLNTPFVIVAGKAEDVVRIYSYFQEATIASDQNVLSTWFDGSYMVLVFGRPGSSMLRLARNYLSDYLYRKPGKYHSDSD